jgi:starch phosphorylase
MTYLALNLSHYVNGVAKRHQEVSRLMFAGYNIDEITNGVHVDNWTSPPFQELFDKHIPGWRQDNFSLRFAHDLPSEEISAAHDQSKAALFATIEKHTGIILDPKLFTIGFARRATAYKRMDLIFQEPERLKRIGKEKGALQLIFSGKAHPNDSGGKEAIQRVIRVRESLLPEVTLVYIENYNLELAKLIVAGVDLWLNTPQAPLEASGTSGMKAAMNGVPSLSTLDGWWLEGWIEGETGWAIGEECSESDPAKRLPCELASLYAKLENIIVPMFYQDRAAFLGVMRHCISLNGSFFNTQRMVQQYVLKAYFE